MKKTLRDILILLSLTILFFSPVLFKYKYLLFISDLQLDFSRHFYASNMFKAGTLPLWDPYYIGPLISCWGSAIFYPFNVVMDLLFVPTDLNFNFRILEYQIIIHFFMASLFTYLLMRRFNLSRFASVFSGTIFAYSGFLVSEVHHQQLLNSGVWIPLILLFFIKAVEDKIHYVLLSGLTLGLCILAGHPQPGVYFFLLLAFLSLYWTYRLSKKEKANGVRFRPIVVCVIAFLVAFGIAAIQILPVLEYIPYGLRAQTTYDGMSALGSVKPAHLITFIAPDFFGGNKIPYWGACLTHIGFWETNYYVGIIPLIFLLLALFSPKKRYFVNFFFGTLLISLFLMLGKNTIASAWLYLVPGFDKIRLPCRLRSIINFSIAILTGFGIDVVIGSQSDNLKKKLNLITKIMFFALIGIILGWLGIFGSSFLSYRGNPEVYYRLLTAANSIIRFIIFFSIGIAILYITPKLKAKKRMRTFLFASIFVIVVIDLFSYQMSFNPRSAFPEDPTSAIEKVNAQKPATFFEQGILKKFRQDKELYRVRARGVYDTGRYVHFNEYYSLGFGGGTAIARLFEFRSLFENPTPPYQFIDPGSPLLDFYNVKYIYSSQDLSEISDKFRKVEDFQNWYKNSKAMSRAFVVSNYLAMPAKEDRLTNLEKVDLEKYVILEERPCILPGESIAGNKSSAQITDYTPMKVELTAEMASPGFLVLSDIWYPGWKAFVNDKEVKIYRANHAFRAVELVEGRHNVKFVYDPISFKLGAWISLLTLLSLMIVWTGNIFRSSYNRRIGPK